MTLQLFHGQNNNEAKNVTISFEAKNIPFKVAQRKLF